MCSCNPPCNTADRALNCEEEPRNAAAIRTAILLGAEYSLDAGGMWQVKGVDIRSRQKSLPAWMYIITFGIGIDVDGRPVPVSRYLEDCANGHE